MEEAKNLKMKVVLVNGSREEAHSELFDVTPAVEAVLSQLDRVREAGQ